MAWSELDVSLGTLQGLARVDWGSKKAGDVKEEVVDQARTMLADMLVHRLSRFVGLAGGRVALLDSIQTAESLSSGLAQLLGRAYLHLDYMERASGVGSAYWDKAMYQYNPDTRRGVLTDALTAFADTVPEALELTDRPVASSGSASLASSMSRYMPTTW